MIFLEFYLKEKYLRKDLYRYFFLKAKQYSIFLNNN